MTAVYDVVVQLDNIFTAFDSLAVGADKIDRKVMQKAIESLDTLKFLPINADHDKVLEAIQKFPNLDSNLKDIMPEVVICISKLCWYTIKAIQNSVKSTSNFVSNVEDIKEIKKR